VFFIRADAGILPGGADTNGVEDVFAVDLLSRLDRDWRPPRRSLGDRDGARLHQRARRRRADRRSRRRRPTNLQEQPPARTRGHVSQFLAKAPRTPSSRRASASPTRARPPRRRSCASTATAAPRRAVNVHVPAGAKRTVFVDEVAPPSASFSMVVESNGVLVTERTVSWDATGYGAHAERASEAPATSWFLAEGSTGGFALFYLLQNPGDTAVTATVRYLRPAPLAPIERTYPLPPHSRTTLPVNTQAPELAGTDVSAAIVSDQPILVERAMYRSVDGQVFAAGHTSAGVTAAATSWFLAEGATGDFFDMFVLLANPDDAADVEIRYLLTTGEV
jgi:hypothetical protein